jgi:hypothetical protein
MMRSLNWRGWSPDTPCAEYAKLQRVAEELLQSLSGAASPEQYAEGQKSLLFLYQELRARVDPLHFRTPGGHRCLDHCFLEYATRLRNKALSPPPAQPESPAPPASDRRHPQRSPDAVVNDVSSLVDEVKQPGDTYLGEER